MIQPDKAAETPKEILRTLRILTSILMIGIIFFAIIIFFLNRVIGPLMEEDGLKYNHIFLWTAAGIALLCLVAARYFYNKKTAIVKNELLSFGDKLNQYRSALISYMALCEGAALFSVIIFFLTGEFLVLIITTLMLAVMVIKFPFPKRVINELNLNWEEQQELA